MITSLNNLPKNLLGFEFSGEITSQDYESVIYPAIKSYIKEQKKIRILCHFNESFKKFDMGAVLDDALMGFKHLLQWEKVALVSDVSWINHSFKALSFLIPGQLKTFHNDEMDTAKKWLEEK